MNYKILVVQTARAGSKSVPNKNIAYIDEATMLFEFPINNIVKHKTDNIDICISTDCNTITKKYEKNKNIYVIKRPEFLSQDNSSHHDVMIHALEEMEVLNSKIYDFVVVLLGNSLGTELNLITKSIKTISEENYSGGMTVSRFNMFNPYRAFKIDKNEIKTHVNVPNNTNDKNCLGDVYFFNGSCFICKRDVLLSKKGSNPFPWVGNKILPIVELSPKMEVDDYWQLTHVRKESNTVWKKYLTRSQKNEIENIKLQTAQWSGYKNVEFNIKIWDNIFSKLNKIGKNKNYNWKVLDYGFGPGWSKVVSSKFENYEVTGLDIDLPKQNTEFCKFHEITGIKTDKWNGIKMPYKDNNFDMMIAKASITKYRNTDKDTVISELVRISKHGAKWLIGANYMAERFMNSLTADNFDLIISKKIEIMAFDWDLKSHQNNIFQPMYAKE